MRSLPIPLRWYLSAVYLCAFILVAAHIPSFVAWHPFTHDHLIILTLVTLLAYVCERTLIIITQAVEATPTIAIYIAATMLLPQPVPLFIALAAMTAAQLPRPKKLYKRAFNIADTTLIVGVSGILFTWINKSGISESLHVGPSATAVVLVVLYPAINYTLLSGVIGLSTKRSMWRAGWDNLHDVAFPDIAMGVIGVLAATLWHSDFVAFAFLVLLGSALYGTVRGTQRITAAEEREREALVRVSMDERTGLPNHQTFQTRLVEETARADPRRSGHSLSLLLVDIDDFRRINDAYGSHAGDAALRDIAALLTRQVRVYDVVTYYGDDEFALILPETDIDAALEVAARIHEQIAALTIVEDAASFHLTVSIGAAMAPMHGDSAPEVIRAAYRAVHAAKTAGKNRSIATDDPSIAKESKAATTDQEIDDQKNGGEGGGLVVRLSDHRR